MSGELPDPREPTPTLDAESAESPRPDAAEAAETPGMSLGRYRLLELLGTGGMGRVWKAWDPALERPVALKTLLPEYASSEPAVARFLREGRLAARLAHPGIVRVMDVGVEGSRLFLAMEIVEGKTLYDLRLERRDVEPHDFLRADIGTLAQIAEAVGYAHANGVIHRDLKPGNVILDRDGCARVADFGLAKDLEDAGARRLTETGRALGTPAYMSPEQVGGDASSVGPGSDVWALGVMLYEILAGRAPFEGEDLNTLFSAIEDSTPVPPSRRREGVPAELEAVCLKALAQAPGDRYADARGFAEDLARWLRGDPVLGRAPGPAVRAWRALLRRRILAPVALALVTALAVGGWGLQVRAQRRAEFAAGVAQIERQVEGLADQFFNTDLTVESMQLPIEQARGLVERGLVEDPHCGVLYSWRARLKELADETAGVDEDYAHGCALAPDDPVVWWLRAMRRLRLYGAVREVPLVCPGSGAALLPAAEAESAAARAARDGATADLAELRRLAGGSGGDLPERYRIALGLAALYFAGGDPAVECVRGSERPEAWEIRAEREYRAGRIPQALAALDKALAAWPRDFTALDLRAECRIAGGLTAAEVDADAARGLGESIEDLSRRIERYPDSDGAYQLRGMALGLLARAQAAQGTDPRAILRASVKDCDEWVKRRPGLAPALSNAAMARSALADAEAARGGDALAIWTSAMQMLDAALGSSADFAPAWHNRGVVGVRLGRAQTLRGLDPQPAYEKACDDFAKALARDPAHKDALWQRAYAHRLLGELAVARGQDPRADLHFALGDYDAVVALDPGSGEARFDRAFARRLLGEAERRAAADPSAIFAQAEEGFREALARGFPRAWLQLGVLYRLQGRFDEAIAAFESGAKELPAQRDWARARIEEVRREAAKGH